MSPAESYKKLPSELEEEYIYRICSNKELIGSWPVVSDIINRELGYEYTESKYRKQYQAFQNMLEANRNIFGSKDGAVNEMRKATDEFHKAKIQFYDQRREYNKNITSDARFEHIKECLDSSARSLNRELPLSIKTTVDSATGDKEAVLVISDIHYGMKTDNIWNKYNTEIARKRLRELTDKTIEYIDFHGPSILHIVILGDCAHGAIHVNARVMAEEDVCDQLMHISEILSEIIGELAEHVLHTNVYCTYGNHMRTIQSAKESVHSDNMEKIIPWWMAKRFDGRKDIEIIESAYYEFIYLDVSGYNVVATHGDLDSFKQMGIVINSIFTKMYGESVDYTISGDKHHLEEFEQLGVESILVRSLCGSDEFANSRRLYSNPGQTLMFFTPDSGRECTYNIRFSV